MAGVQADKAAEQANGRAEENIPEMVLEPDKDKAAEAKKRKRRRMKALRSFLFRLLGLALVVYILLFHIVGLTTMPNGDMAPRLDAGDLLLFYRIERSPKAQDIVVIDKAVNAEGAEVTATHEEPGFFRKVLNWIGFKDPSQPPTHRFVCRVIAGPGDTVEITPERGLVVNGNTQVEPKIFYATYPYEGDVTYPIRLGEGEWFVLSDYRNGGADSRFFGPVRHEEIQGVVITVLRRNNL